MRQTWTMAEEMRWLSRSPKCPLLAAVSYTIAVLFVIGVLRFLPGVADVNYLCR